MFPLFVTSDCIDSHLFCHCIVKLQFEALVGHSRPTDTQKDSSSHDHSHCNTTSIISLRSFLHFRCRQRGSLILRVGQPALCWCKPISPEAFNLIYLTTPGPLIYASVRNTAQVARSFDALLHHLLDTANTSYLAPHSPSPSPSPSPSLIPWSHRDTCTT